uniref:Rhodanese domain-containing protein n=1 Tax=Onchocerca volvulus TaxID=6282 RepID=A0A8R1XPD1_ONCVO
MSKMVNDIDAITLAKLVQKVDPLKKTIIVDCRSFVDYNQSHIRYAINAFYSKMMRRRVYDNKVCDSIMLSQIGEEKCNSTLVDLVLYSENDETVGKQSLTNNYSTVFSSSGIKRKHQNGVKCSGDESSQKLLRTLQEKFTSSKRFNNVLILRGKFFFLFSSLSLQRILWEFFYLIIFHTFIAKKKKTTRI